MEFELDFVFNGILITFAGLIGSLAIFGLYKLLRPKFNVKVNCWFCNTDCVVPFGNKNCWDCPSCEQYNGFDESGDYNKPIPSQYDELLNHATRFSNQKSDGDLFGNELCDDCNRNQMLKTKQMAAFVPQNEDYFDEEIESYRLHLEKVYKLCRPCEGKLCQKLGQQSSSLRSIIFSWRLKKKGQESTKSARISPFSNRFSYTVPIYVRLLQIISLAFNVLVVLQVFHALQTKTRKEIYNLDGILPAYLIDVEGSNLALSYFGFFSLMGSIFAAGKDRLQVVDALDSFVWLVTLFIQLPIATSLFPSVEDKLIVQVLTCCLVTILTLCCVLWPRPIVSYRNSWNSSLSSSSSYDSISLASPSIAGDKSSVWNDSVTSNGALLQDSHITTTTNHSRTSSALSVLDNKVFGFDLDTNLKAMKISTPRKNHKISGVFTKRTYSSPHIASPPLSACGITAQNATINCRRSVLSPARFKSKSITQSSWVAGGFWAKEVRSSHSQNRGNKESVASYSCPVSRAGSIVADDKLSVFSEPSHSLMTASLPFRESWSPFRDNGFDSSTNSSSDSSCKSCCRILKDTLEKQAVESKNSKSNSKDDNFEGQRSGIKIYTFLLLSIVANAVLVGLVLFRYFSYLEV